MSTINPPIGVSKTFLIDSDEDISKNLYHGARSVFCEIAKGPANDCFLTIYAIFEY